MVFVRGQYPANILAYTSRHAPWGTRCRRRVSVTTGSAGDPGPSACGNGAALAREKDGGHAGGLAGTSCDGAENARERIMRDRPLTETALRRLSLFGNEVKSRAVATWEIAKRAQEWCLKPRPSWWRPGQVWQWLNQRPQIGLPLAAIVTVLLLVALFHWFWPWYSCEETDYTGGTHYRPHADILNPIAAALGGAVLVWAAFRQAWIAGNRHKAQTDADRERRLTESYSKAVEQLSHADMAVRLGGIYSLEQISQESQSRYWTVMETLAAFVRERASWKETAPRVSERAYFLWQDAGLRMVVLTNTGAKLSEQPNPRRRAPTSLPCLR
jgi:hypothetical protein